MNALAQLELPEREPPRRETFDWHPRALGAWIDELPLANLGAAAPQVYRALHQLNRWELPARERLAALERLVPLVDYLVQALRRRCLGRPLPLQGNTARAAALARRLLAETALGHEIAASSMPGGLRRRHRVALALQRALHFRARELLEHWLVYRPPEPGLWARVHQLFALAEAEGVSTTRVRATDGSGASPGTAYKQLLLCAAVGPHRLAQHEIPEAWALLGRLADSARLTEPGASDASGEAVYRVPRSADGPPHAAITELDRSDDRLLETAPLLAALQRTLDTARGAPGRLTQADPELASRLALALAAVPRRRHRRLRAEARTEVQAGFAQVHAILCERLGRPTEAIERERSRFEAGTPQASRERRDVWSVLYPNELLSALREADGEQADAGRTEAGRHQPAQADDDVWQLVNISATGYCLLAGDTTPRRLGVGELLLLRELAGRGLPAQLGAVRWLRATDKGGLEVGIEILGTDPVPLELRAELEGGRFGPLERALLLPRNEHRDQPPTLLAPGPHFAAGRGARLRHGRRESELDLLREHDATAHYVQLEFQRRHADDDAGELTTLLGD